jgi:hypothetical protein
VFADIRDHAIDRFGSITPRLVAISAQIALSTVECSAFDGEEIYRIGGFESKVSGGVGGMDLVAGTAILTGRMWITSLYFAWV